MKTEAPPDAAEERSTTSRVIALSSLTAFPLLLWWLGFFPGFVSSDTIDQLGQVDRFEFANFHPAFHTISMWLVTRIWDSPGAISLVHVLAMATLLTVIAKRLVELGLSVRIAVGSVWFVSLLPAVGITTIALWKDVPFTLALLWVFSELLAMARDSDAFWSNRPAILRLGVALSLVWLFRHNGFVTVVPLLAVLALSNRAQLGAVGRAAATTLAIVGFVLIVGYRVLPVQTASIEPSEVLIPDIAAILTEDESSFSQADLDLLGRIAPIDVWTSNYNCFDSTRLVFSPDFDAGVIRSDPAAFRSLAVSAVLRNPDLALVHRACAASYLFVPAQPESAFFHRPPFDIPPNTLGIGRDPVVWKAHLLTKPIYVWAGDAEHLWLTWRPAIAIWLGLVAYGFLGYRRQWSLLWPGSVFIIHLVNVAATSPAQEFRYAFGLYVIGLLSVPLIGLAEEARPVPATRR